MKPLDAREKERLVEEFRACLDEVAETPEEPRGDEDDAGIEDEAPVDLYTLLAEMAALKNEVRIESRQFKGAIEELRRLSDALHERNERLTRDLERARLQAADAQRHGARRLLHGVLDLRDRLQAGVDLAAARKPSALPRWLSGQTSFATQLVEGMALTLKRLDDLLDAHRVRPVPAVGQPLDPDLMRAIGVERHAGRADGVVLCEARRGFFYDGELLRTAEVIVNKQTEDS